MVVCGVCYCSCRLVCDAVLFLLCVCVCDLLSSYSEQGSREGTRPPPVSFTVKKDAVKAEVSSFAFFIVSKEVVKVEVSNFFFFFFKFTVSKEAVKAEAEEVADSLLELAFLLSLGVVVIRVIYAIRKLAPHLYCC